MKLVYFARVREQIGRQEETVTLPAGPRGRMLVTHLTAGRWRAVPAAGPAQVIAVTEAAGAAWWEGSAGTWTLARE